MRRTSGAGSRKGSSSRWVQIPTHLKPIKILLRHWWDGLRPKQTSKVGPSDTACVGDEDVPNSSLSWTPSLDFPHAPAIHCQHPYKVQGFPYALDSVPGGSLCPHSDLSQFVFLLAGNDSQHLSPMGSRQVPISSTAYNIYFIGRYMLQW